MNQATARTLWRELVNEFDSSVISDTRIDSFMDLGLAELNRAVEFSWADDNSITTVNGTQEYAFPANTVRIIWVRLNGAFVPKTDIDDLKRQGIDFVAAAAAQPTFYYTFARTLGFYPKPNAAQVITLRTVQAPLSFQASGFDSLSPEDDYAAVYFAAKAWTVAHPDNQLAQMRIQAMEAQFEGAVQRMSQQYAQRFLSR